MANTNVNVIMTAQEARMAEAWLRARRSVGQFEDGLRKAGATGQASGRKIAGGVDAVIPSLSRAAMTFMGIATAVQGVATAARLIRAEWEQLKDVQKQSAERSISAGQSLAQVRLQMPPGADITTDEVWDMASGAQSRAGMDQRMRVINEAISAGTEAKTTRSRAEIGKTILERLDAFDEEVQSTFAKGATFLKEVYPESSADELISQLNSALSASPAGLANMEQFLQNIVPSAARLKAQGFTLREGFSELIGQQVRTLDVEGATTRTNVEQMIEDVNQRLMENNRGDLVGKGKKTLSFITDSDDPIADLIRADLLRGFEESLFEISRESDVPMEDLLSEKGLQNLKLSDELRARAKGIVGIRERLQKKGFAEGFEQAKARVQQTEAVILEGPAAVADLERRVKEGRQAPNQRAFEVDAAVKAAKESLLQDQDQAARQQQAQTLEELLPLLGEGAQTKNIRSLVSRLTTGEDTSQEVVSELASLIEQEAEKSRNIAARATGERGLAQFVTDSMTSLGELMSDPLQTKRLFGFGSRTSKRPTARDAEVEEKRAAILDELGGRLRGITGDVPIQSPQQDKLDTLIELQKQAMTNPTPVTVANPKDLLQKNAPRASAAGNLRDPQPAAF